jgi:MinD-like ATPase involved in chromosome partitioning or flagellar assembly
LVIENSRSRAAQCVMEIAAKLANSHQKSLGFESG